MIQESILAEVFGFSVSDNSERAVHYRENRLCPFNNKAPNCTKDKVENPLGVCSIFEKGRSRPVITCPVRFRQDWVILREASRFFFPPGTRWTSLTEVPLTDAEGELAGNLDFVLVSYDENGQLMDFGAVEVQAVYISGNVRRMFEAYMRGETTVRERFKPRPDYLSSSRKRLVPQLLYKGYIFKEWNKRLAVVVQEPFFGTLPDLPQISDASKASLAWLIFDLEERAMAWNLYYSRTVYTEFRPAMEKLITPTPGSLEDFEKYLQEKLNERLGSKPETHTLFDLELVE